MPHKPLTRTTQPQLMTYVLVNPLPAKIRKLSYRAIADLTDLNHAKLFRQLSGRTPLMVDTVGRIAAAFDVPIGDLLASAPVMVPYQTPKAPPAYSDHLDTSTDETTQDGADELPAHLQRRAEPWLLTADEVRNPPPHPGRLPDWPAVHLQTPELIATLTREERVHNWAEYRHYAQAGNYAFAVAAIQDELRPSKKSEPITKTAARVVAHLNTHGPIPADPADSIAQFLKSQKR